MDNPYQGIDFRNDYANAQGAYNRSVDKTQQRQEELSTYQKNMVDPAKMYGNYLGQAQKMYGFNPSDLLVANKNLARTNTAMANLPQAVQQQGGYYGTTAGQMANAYQQQAGNLQALLTGQANAAGVYKDVLGATQQQANQQAGLGLEGQKLNVQALTAIMQNALGIQEQQGGAVGRVLGGLQNYGDYLNALKQAQAAQLSAQAAMSQAAAQNTIAGATAGLYGQQGNQIAQQISLAGEAAQNARNAGRNPAGSIPLGVSQASGQSIRLGR